MDILIFATGLWDYKKRRIPNFLIIAIGIFAVLLSNVPSKERFAGFIVTLPFLFIAIANDKIIKGGDAKFLCVIATALGLKCFISVLGLTFVWSIIWTVITREKSVPLAFMFLMGYFIYSII